MTDGNWDITINGRGKIHPADADEIQQLLVGFIQQLTAAGHEVHGSSIQKNIG